MGRGKSQRSLALVDAAIGILAEIQPAPVRAVCYKLFTLGIIDSTAKSERNDVSVQLTWAREQRRIPWSWIVDEHREAERVSAWEDPGAYADTVKRAYVERYGNRCWELDALSPVILRDRVEQAMVLRIDGAVWNRAEVAEAAEMDSLTSILNEWSRICGRASKYESGGAA
jgi:hypothetical protein